MEEEKELSVNEQMKQQIEQQMKQLMCDGIQMGNIDLLYKLEDIKKDICNEEYWKKKGEMMAMRYRGSRYSGYGDDYSGNYGRESYGRRGVPGTGRRYSGEDVLGEMGEHYRRYEEGKESFGGEGLSVKALEYMLDLDKEFIKMLMKDAKTPEEKELIEEHIQEMSEL